MSDANASAGDRDHEPTDASTENLAETGERTTNTADGVPDTGKCTRTLDEHAIDSETRRGRKKRDVLTYLEWAGLALCIVLVLVAGLRVYTGVGAFISLWVTSRYEPIVSAGFNLAVLLVAAYGAATLSRRLTASR